MRLLIESCLAGCHLPAHSLMEPWSDVANSGDITLGLCHLVHVGFSGQGMDQQTISPRPKGGALRVFPSEYQIFLY